MFHFKADMKLHGCVQIHVLVCLDIGEGSKTGEVSRYRLPIDLPIIGWLDLGVFRTPLLSGQISGQPFPEHP